MDRLRAKMAAGVGKSGSNPGVVGAFRNMLAEGGIRGLWTGNGANIVQVGPESALLFLLNDLYKPYVAQDPKNLTIFERFTCGSAAGATSMTLVYPMYVIQNRMLVMPDGYYKGIYDCARKTYVDGGLRAFAGGYGASFVRIIPYKGIDMAGYSLLKDPNSNPNPNPNPNPNGIFSPQGHVLSRWMHYD